MSNFLSKFLSPKFGREREQEADMTSSPEHTPPASALESNPGSTSETASDSTPDTTQAMPERPMYDASPGAGMELDDPYAMEEFITSAGESLLAGSEVADEDAIVEVIRTVYDPEIPVNIYDLGLIYTIRIEDNGDVFVDMSLTAPGCPVAGEMPGMVSTAVSQLDTVGVVTTKIVWEPAWTPDRMSEDAKLALGMF